MIHFSALMKTLPVTLRGSQKHRIETTLSYFCHSYRISYVISPRASTWWEFKCRNVPSLSLTHCSACSFLQISFTFRHFPMLNTNQCLTWLTIYSRVCSHNRWKRFRKRQRYRKEKTACTNSDVIINAGFVIANQVGGFTLAIWSTSAWIEKFNNGLFTHFSWLHGLKSTCDSSHLINRWCEWTLEACVTVTAISLSSTFNVSSWCNCGYDTKPHAAHYMRYI